MICLCSVFVKAILFVINIIQSQLIKVIDDPPHSAADCTWSRQLSSSCVDCERVLLIDLEILKF